MLKADPYLVHLGRAQDHAIISYNFLGDAAADGSNIESKKQELERLRVRCVMVNARTQTEGHLCSSEGWVADPVGNTFGVKIPESSFAFAILCPSTQIPFHRTVHYSHSS